MPVAFAGTAIHAGLVLMLLACLAGTALADSQSIATRTEVPADQWQAIKMRGLPGGANIEVTLEADGRLRLFIVDEDQFAQLAEGGEALFASDFQGRFRFSLRIPEAADYYLVLDNRQGNEPRRVSVGITGSR